MRKRIIFGLLVICVLFSLSLSSCGKSKEAQIVDDLIANIGVVDLGNGDARILDAEEAFEALSDKDQQSLENLEELHEARRGYDQLLAEREELINISAKEIEDVINEIGTVNLSSLADIQAALEKYKEADTAVQEAVTNYVDLVEADMLISKIFSNYTELINYIKDLPSPITYSKPGLRRNYAQEYALTYSSEGLILMRIRKEMSAISKENITFYTLEDKFIYEIDFINTNMKINNDYLSRVATYSGRISSTLNATTLSEESFQSPNGTHDFLFGDRVKRINAAEENINEMLGDMKVILAELPLDITLRDLGIAGLD